MAARKKTFVAWIAPHQVKLAKEVAKLANLKLVAIGSSDQSVLPDMATKLKTDSCDDLRTMITEYDDALLWIAEPSAYEVSICELLHHRTKPTVTTTPLSGNMEDLVPEAGKTPAAKYIPLFRRSKSYGVATDDIEQFGQPVSAHCTMTCSDVEGTLWSRLFDAMDTMNGLFGTPETVQAFLHSTQIPDEPSDLLGHMTVNLQFQQQRCATLLLSDQSSWKREVQMVGKDHSITFGDDDTTPAQLIADGMQTTESTMADAPRVLALCEAARLSCLTGSSESPSRVLEMF